MGPLPPAAHIGTRSRICLAGVARHYSALIEVPTFRSWEAGNQSRREAGPHAPRPGDWRRGSRAGPSTALAPALTPIGRGFSSRGRRCQRFGRVDQSGADANSVFSPHIARWRGGRSDTECGCPEANRSGLALVAGFRPVVNCTFRGTGANRGARNRL
jgi:hypothetical protein